MLFVHMDNGIYKIFSQHNGVMFTKTIKVVSHKGVNVRLNWKSSTADDSPDEM